MEKISYWGIILAVVGILQLIYNQTNNMSELKVQDKMVSNWYSQLPDNHWIKQDDDYDFNYEIMDLINSCKSYASGLFNLNIDMMSYEDGKAGELMSYALKREVKKIGINMF